MAPLVFLSTGQRIVADREEYCVSNDLGPRVSKLGAANDKAERFLPCRGVRKYGQENCTSFYLSFGWPLFDSRVRELGNCNAFVQYWHRHLLCSFARHYLRWHSRRNYLLHHQWHRALDLFDRLLGTDYDQQYDDS